MRKIKKFAFVLALALVFASLTACDQMGGGTAPAASDYPVIYLAPGAVQQTVGPFGEPIFPADELYLTDEEIAQIRAGNYTAAIVFHYAGSDWSRLQQVGIEAKFAELGVEIVAVTNADFSAEVQVANIETVMALNPDVIISIPVDPVATADAYRRAAEAGISIVFMCNVPDGMVAGVHYVGAVSSDNYGSGVNAARMLAQAIGGEGRIGHIFHDANFFVTNQRDEAFRNTIRDEFPDIEIVESAGFDDAARAGEIADAMLTRTPDLDGIFATWDTAAEAVVSSAIAAGRPELFITTVDLGDNVARMIAEKGNMVGLSAQRPFHQGQAQAIKAGMALVGRPAPAYSVVPPLPVFFNNLIEAYEVVNNQSAPGWLIELHESNR